ncbi:MAG: glycosyltransferase [Roseovarius sp.]|nr:glycosyltransferase [Roseovarius sp.]
MDFLIAAHDEAPHIVAKIGNCLDQDNPAGHRLRVLVVSDGSTDGTADLARSVDDDRVTVMETPGRVGKLAAVNIGLERLTGDVVVFSDANGLLAPGSLGGAGRTLWRPAGGRRLRTHRHQPRHRRQHRPGRGAVLAL